MRVKRKNPDSQRVRARATTDGQQSEFGGEGPDCTSTIIGNGIRAASAEGQKRQRYPGPKAKGIAGNLS